jgi:hypothetical protein
MKPRHHQRMNTGLGAALLLAAALAAALPAASASAAGAPAGCREQITYRLWNEDTDRATEHPYGDDIEVESGAHLHLYVQALGQSEKPLGASATIGYPGEFGFGGTVLETLKRLRMEAQNAADRQYGRIRFTADQEGGTSLGYRIEGVDSPGSLERLAQGCRVGQVNFTVLPKKAAPAVVEPQAIAPREAAEQLVVLLYYGLLRRKIVDQVDQSYVEWVDQRHLKGLEQVAETIFESREFRDSAFRRAEERHGPMKRGGKATTELLLGDIYSALYGRARPPQADVRRDLEDLDVCLKGKSWVVETCGRLGRTLVANPLFYKQNQDLVDALGVRN